MPNFESRATELLAQLTGNRRADMEGRTLAAIQAIVEDRAGALVVQRTGRGKSAV